VIELRIDGEPVQVDDGATVLDACRAAGVDTPTICYAENLTPVNVCRACVVEVDGSRTLVPACSRVAEPEMVVQTDSERVRNSRRLVFELLASGVNLDQAPELARWADRYGAKPERFGEPAEIATVDEPVRRHDELYVRDYSRCVLCYKCVEACGDDAQHTYAIAVAGRGFDARISTEFDVNLTDSACVYCGNCIGVCPTNALQFTTEFDLRAAGEWKPDE
jgi:predicted molibdopterin-dependent oxidoreductase YjgC